MAAIPKLGRKQRGMVGAHCIRMTVAQRFEELIAWQLSENLKEEIFRLTDRDHVRRDSQFCEQIRGSARSAPANIAEGFGWFEPKPNARHVAIAKASLEETRNHAIDGFKRRYFSEPEHEALQRLARRALIATTRYLRYLRSCKSAPLGTDRTRRTGGT